MAFKSKINLGPTPSSITWSARGVFPRGTFPLILTAQQLLLTSSSRAFCGSFTHIYYNAVNLVRELFLRHLNDEKENLASTYLTMLYCCSLFSLAFYKGNVFQRTADNRTMTQGILKRHICDVQRGITSVITQTCLYRKIPLWALETIILHHCIKAKPSKQCQMLILNHSWLSDMFMVWFFLGHGSSKTSIFNFTAFPIRSP